MDISKCKLFHVVWMLTLICVFSPILRPEAQAQCNGKSNQNSRLWDFDENDSEKFSINVFLSDLFTPQIITDTKRIRKYIRDKRFKELQNRCGDMRAIDAVYLKALKIAEYNIARALFLSLMAVLEHRQVLVKMPIFSSFEVPLTFEKESIFFNRIEHLPVRLYEDTPDSPEGDRDKLQHFFASAYLAYVTEAPEFARATGNIVEWGEASFIVGGVDDLRDKRANYQGESFGCDLLIVQTLLPSDYLTFPYEDRK